MNEGRNEHCNEISVALYANGKLEPDKVEAFERHIARCDVCKKNLEELREIKNTLNEKHPFEKMPANPGMKAVIDRCAGKGDVDAGRNALPNTGRPAGGTNRKNTVLPFQRKTIYAIAATLILFLAAGSFFMTHMRGNGSHTVKGSAMPDPSLFLYVKQPDGSAGQRADQRYLPGEQIQFAYASRSQPYLILMSVDESGKTTILFPQKGDSAAAIETNGTYAVPEAFTLDSYLGRELYLAFFSDKKISIREMENKVSERYTENRALEAMRFDGNGTIRVKTLLTTKVHALR